MAVIKNLRSLSEMEFYKNAIYIRKDITRWIIRDFGAKRNYKSIKQVIKYIKKKKKKTIDDIYVKYNKNPNKEYQSVYPEWFVNYERTIISKILSDIVINITQANSIYPYKDFEWDLRRKFQDKAIADCYCLIQELQYIVSLFPTDLNRFCYLLDNIERETMLLKGWRQSDNKKREN